jgi:hypothetical protein
LSLPVPLLPLVLLPDVPVVPLDELELELSLGGAVDPLGAAVCPVPLVPLVPLVDPEMPVEPVLPVELLPAVLPVEPGLKPASDVSAEPLEGGVL